MTTKKVHHMNTGNGESSYARNSYLQGTGFQRSLPVLHEAINGIASNLNGFPKCLNIADLGCPSGPNTLFFVTNIIDSVHVICSEHNIQVPQFQVFLNYLFENDFNTVFRLLPAFYTKVNKKGDECFVLVVPGSFYDRLFTNESVHLFHSSYAVHWLSQVPHGIENNKLNIYMAKTSPTNVFESYRKQLEKDFTKLLRLRSQELIHGGHMILTFPARSIADPTSEDCCVIWELLAKSLVDMVTEGMVQESKVSSFNIPYHTPHEEEVRDIIQKEGSFSLHSLIGFALNWEPYDTDKMNTDVPGIHTAKLIRAVIEPMMATHFGTAVMDMLFKKYEDRLVDHLATKKGMNYNLIISLIKH
ncbi:benzoate carboxyl methyltransferase-like [Bidens hawaiensis]|uniref:benzoate carboxyl methyltransferase-like n=1 Tax=Bidens hawaiensis TaxID=980011 RepID=UPI00404A8DD0